MDNSGGLWLSIQDLERSTIIKQMICMRIIFVVCLCLSLRVFLSFSRVFRLSSRVRVCLSSRASFFFIFYDFCSAGARGGSYNLMHSID